jgi:hypothetical protein
MIAKKTKEIRRYTCCEVIKEPIIHCLGWTETLGPRRLAKAVETHDILAVFIWTFYRALNILMTLGYRV